jgi:hypothetical protein
VVGLGTQDSFTEAQDFVARHGVTFRMFWDRGFVSKDGRELKRWIGRLYDDDHADILRLATA